MSNQIEELRMINDIHKSLLLFPQHICCDDAESYLYPPRRGSNGYIYDRVGAIKYKAIPHWYIDLGDGGPKISVSYCPFCGVKLPNDDA